MGHERLGVLPKTKPWSSIVQELGSFSEQNDNISKIARMTLKNVRSRLERVERDRGVQAAFEYLVLLMHASTKKDPNEYFKSIDIPFPDEITPLQLAKSLSTWVSNNSDSHEYSVLAKNAAIDALNIWYKKNSPDHYKLFNSTKDPYEVLKKGSSGAGFCELSRLFFSKFTEKYLKYFLERAASAQIYNMQERDLFDSLLTKHIEEISKHSFQIAKITESFAAGWFNKYARERTPERKEMIAFLAIAFGKIRDELLQEEISE